ncbi:MAG: sel1 repeat family protein, partial [Devosia sp.]|nr:sel1 repeat family protein [Devosia sp.]
MLVLLLPVSAGAQDAPIASICGMAAASQYEPGYRGFGRDLSRIDTATAIPACEEAVKAAPDLLANKAWLARALLADGQTEAALPLLEVAVAGDSALGRQLLADVLFGDLGDIATPDDARALEVLRPAAEAGFAPAQLSLGFAYDLGRGLDEDNAIAASWYMRAAQQGEARAASNLGYLYHGGDGVALDYQQAMFWYQKGADKGDVVGIYGVGQLYEFGQGVEIDYGKAAEQFRLGAEMGDSYAQNDLGFLYETGQGVGEDLAEAARYYQMASDQGYALASANLAQLYSTGRGVERDFDRALELYSYAHDQGEVGGTVGLAQAYLYGEGVPVDFELARGYAEQAADAGASYGQSTLGAIYADGSGVARDFNHAIELFDLAAAQGNDYAASRAAEVRAEQTCGLIAATRYETGFEVSGVELERIDADTAVPVCANAVALDAASLENKGWYARTLIAGGRQAEAAPLLEEAAGGGFIPAKVLLADLLLWGHGVGEDPARAVTLYQAAAAEGFPPAE